MGPVFREYPVPDEPTDIEYLLGYKFKMIPSPRGENIEHV